MLKKGLSTARQAAFVFAAVFFTSMILCTAPEVMAAGNHFANDSVFVKGISTVGYDSLDTKQKEFYRSIDEKMNAFIDSSSDLTPSRFFDEKGSPSLRYVIGKIDFYNDTLFDVNAAYRAYDYDHPAYYWISNDVMVDESNKYFYVLTEPEYANVADRERINGLVETGVKSIAALADRGADTLDKIMVVHDKIVSTVDYAYKTENGKQVTETAKWAHSVQGVFDTQKHVVCEGYADAFSLVMNYMGIPNYYITGKAGNAGPGGGEGHAWNAVSDDGGKTYMYMDLTWDDKGASGYTYSFFGMPKTDFETTHSKYDGKGLNDKWLYDIKTDNFNDSAQGAYYARAGYSYDTNAGAFVKRAITRSLRFGKNLTFTASSGEDLATLMAELGIYIYNYDTITYEGVPCYVAYLSLDETVDISDAVITIDKDQYKYTGSEICPEPVVTINGVKLVKEVNYTVSYNDNVKEGSGAKVTVTGTGSFTGKVSRSFSIISDKKPEENKPVINKPDPDKPSEDDPGKKKKTIAVKSVSISKKSSTVKVGKTLTLTAKISPSKATDKTVTWKSLSPKIAKVEGNGLKATVKGLKAGKARIRVTASNGKKKEVVITVKGPVEAKSVSITRKTSKLEVGKTTKLSAKISPSNTENKTVTWKSMTPSVASVEAKGLKATVKGLKAGKARIRVTTANGKKKDVTFTVKTKKVK
ncbi:MAG: Ig-like domain-containing protein [Lachnospiraceae bacterium]|nr:Ig-like domain-containing protein [Lachnospiraceae bacterium]